MCPVLNRLIVLVFLVSLIPSGLSFAQQNVWTGNGDGISWGDGFNWEFGIPTTSQDATVDEGGLFLVSVNGTFDVGSISVGNDDVINIINSRLINILGSGIDNQNLINLQSTGSNTDLRIVGTEATFSGLGEIRMSDSFTNRIFGSLQTNILTNLSLIHI